MTVFSVIFILSGLLLMSWVIYPIASFQFFYQPKYANLLRPVAEADAADNFSDNLYQVVGAAFEDYTRASYWFPKAANFKLSRNQTSYTLSIPKLNITDAFVDIGGEDLTKSLIQFTGPMPGEIGNPVVFGHSTLLWFYNPSDYKAIFSKLPDLEINDEIVINSDNVTYTYLVKEMYITSPKDLSVLNQTDKEELLTLVTCVPPGTYLKRFIVKAKLSKI